MSLEGRTQNQNGLAVDDDSPEELDRDALEARVDLLEVENERLRERYAQTRRSSYRRTALGLAGLGLVSAIGGGLFPAFRDVLFVIAAIGLFGGLLTYYLTPERFVMASVAERVYDALATNEADLVADLGLSDDHVYLPDGTTATLFVPQDDTDPLPASDDLEGPLVVTETTRGLALTPSGGRLFEEFERTLAGPLADSPGPVARQVTDALVEAFELADRTDLELDTADGRLTVAFHGSAYPNAFDTPPASLLATAMAVGLDRPVHLTTAPADDATFTATCRWEVEEDPSTEEDEEPEDDPSAGEEDEPQEGADESETSEEAPPAEEEVGFDFGTKD